MYWFTEDSRASGQRSKIGHLQTGRFSLQNLLGLDGYCNDKTSLKLLPNFSCWSWEFMESVKIDDRSANNLIQLEISAHSRNMTAIKLFLRSNYKTSAIDLDLTIYSNVYLHWLTYYINDLHYYICLISSSFSLLPMKAMLSMSFLSIQPSKDYRRPAVGLATELLKT